MELVGTIKTFDKLFERSVFCRCLVKVLESDNIFKFNFIFKFWQVFVKVV